MILHGDCLERLREIPDASVDMVLADLPYGTTACKWDTVIPFEPLWKELRRVTKPNAAMCFFGSEPFSTALRSSNLREFRYDWIWSKSVGGGFLNANRQPLKRHEVVSVFYRRQPGYVPQKGIGKPYKAISAPVPESSHIRDKSSGGNVTVNNGDRYPTTILKFANDTGHHPTQKPVALLEYLIRTYTNEGDLVLDPTCGSGSAGVAALKTGRRFVGIEREAEYAAIATRRMEAACPSS